MTYVAHEHDTAGRQQFRDAVEHRQQVVGRGEVLHDRVQNHRVEVAPREASEFAGGLGAQPYAAAQVRLGRDLPRESADDDP